MSEFVNHNNASDRPDASYAGVIKKIQADGVCPFCPENLAKYHKNPILAEGSFWLLTDNMYPYEGAKHHTLFIHKEHIRSLEQLTAEAWDELRRMVKNFLKERNILGGTLMMRFGDTNYTGASVSHLHANLVSPDGKKKDRKPIIVRVG